MINKSIIITAILFSYLQAGAQVYTNKEVGKKGQVIADSLKKTEYPYALPIWGAKAHKAGYNLPYSAGISVNYLWQESDLVLENLMVGFNNGPKHDLDELVRFDKAISKANIITIRPDIWLFPFLNVYGILGRSVASTDVGYGLWIPDSTNTPKKVAEASSKVEFNATTAGIGLTPTYGIGGGFIALDMSFTWTDVPQLKKPAFAFVFGPRIGKNFRFKRPEHQVAIWVGGFRFKINGETDGSVNMADVLPTEELEQKVENGITKVNDAQGQVDAWWNNLSDAQQNNPVNKAKYSSANALLERAGQFMNRLDQAVGTAATSSVQYSMDKSVKDMWNFLVGSQYQINKHWMLRGEAGFLSSRTQFLFGLQYRFGL